MLLKLLPLGACDGDADDDMSLLLLVWTGLCNNTSRQDPAQEAFIEDGG